jgi:hypothetical protein
MVNFENWERKAYSYEEMPEWSDYSFNTSGLADEFQAEVVAAKFDNYRLDDFTVRVAD